ncbi:hypothetical protein NDU88_003730 [Pleurodeles waltl]|uniref:Uncharacterized protein n=1 Tax=Pleurodeles waltl TaxID=8319 RepID=A0AAV7RJ16_PLEWA|nr:hypothetical protein NDU88_003730 [Pleurodeles waltl]
MVRHALLPTTHQEELPAPTSLAESGEGRCVPAAGRTSSAAHRIHRLWQLRVTRLLSLRGTCRAAQVSRTSTTPTAVWVEQLLKRGQKRDPGPQHSKVVRQSIIPAA